MIALLSDSETFHLCPCRGKVVVPKGKVLTFQGIGNPVLAYDDTANSAGSTSKSASTTILADDFIATGITFQVKNEYRVSEYGHTRFDSKSFKHFDIRFKWLKLFDLLEISQIIRINGALTV